ncbi:hypothetical protein R3P82_12600 [Dietzia maris]|uniref:Uncharacterized protein n=1 Tax=Dietzia maris TaxID=37915 RepID=A0AAE4R099_9ACTN|nr:hypothetical protein [Dietzia maris]MDV6299949.1 hypothetical protein [Dietzia maris]
MTPLTIEVESVEGDLWPLAGPGAGGRGVTIDKDKVQGLWHPPTVTRWRSGATQIGATYAGKSYEPRDIQFRVLMAPERVPGMSLDRLETEFDACFDEEVPARLIVRYGGSKRWLWVTKFKEPVLEYNGNSAAAVYTLRAAFPFYESDPHLDVMVSTVEALAGSVAAANITDLPVYPRWVLTGGGQWTLPDHSWITDPEHEDYEFADRTITLPAIDSDEELVVDTFPDVETVTSNKNPMFYARMNWRGEPVFPVPRWTPRDGQPVALPISCTEPGGIAQLRLPRYWKKPIGGDRL